MVKKNITRWLFCGLVFCGTIDATFANDNVEVEKVNLTAEDAEAKWNPVQFLFWNDCQKKDVIGLRLLAMHKAQRVYGLDILSFVPSEEAYGIQCSIVSHISETGKGIQVALGNNYTNYSGLQAAAVNMTVDNSKLSRASGLQVAIINFANFLDGVQVGLWNSANWGGAQIGLINSADAAKVQIGLLNINKNSSLFPVLPLINVSNGEEQNQTKASWF